MGFIVANLEVLENNLLELSKSNEIAENINNGTITDTNFKNRYSQLQYKLKGSAIWKNALWNDKITSLSAGIYQFQRESKNGEKYVKTNSKII